MPSKTDIMDVDSTGVFQLRRLGPDDIHWLKDLEAATSLTWWGEENYRRFLAELSEYFAFGITRQRVGATALLTGFALGRSIFEDLELLKIGVLPQFQRFGFGTQLLEAILAEGQLRGATRCFLEVRKSNQKALQFYASHQFHIAGARHNYYSNPVEDAWIMERLVL